MLPWPLQRGTVRLAIGLSLLAVFLWVVIAHIGVVTEILWMGFAAFLLSTATRPIAEGLGRWRVPYSVTILASYVLLLGAIVLLGSAIVPILGMEVANLRSNGPALVQRAAAYLSTTPWIGPLLPSSSMLAQFLAGQLGGVVGAVGGTLATIGDLGLDLVVILVLAFFFSTDATLGDRLLHYWVPPRYHLQSHRVATRLRHRLTHWVWAQLAIAAYFGLVYSVGLSLLGVPFAVIIGLVGGALEIVPYIGGAVSLALALLSALTVQPTLVLWVLLFHTVVVEVESHLLAPLFYGRVTGLHPALFLIALWLGLRSGGILGVFFAVPVAVVLLTLLDELRIVLPASESGESVASVENQVPEEPSPPDVAGIGARSGGMSPSSCGTGIHSAGSPPDSGGGAL